MKTLLIAGSNSSSSINKQLVKYAGVILKDAEYVDLTELDIPMFGEDLEKEIGSPDGVKKLASLITGASSIVIATPEHNGALPAFFKNILDWLSRTSRTYMENTKVVVLATSPGPGGANSALSFLTNGLGYVGADVVSSFSLPSFYDNFDVEKGEIKTESFSSEFKKVLGNL